MASFIRQLNMYGFHKITSIDNGGLRFDRDEMEFTHPCFQKDHPYLLEHIKRKIATSKQQQLQAQQQADDKSALKLEAVGRVLSEVKNMRGRQDSLDSRFQTMKQENEALWREIAILRQKHHKQQQIVNKLIQFLVTIVQPSRSGLNSMSNGGTKRRYQLMINDAPQQAKLKKSNYDEDDGATIEELGEALEEVAYANQQELLSKQDKGKKHATPIVTGQIVRTSRAAGDMGANISSASGSTIVVGQSSKATNSGVGGSSGGSAILTKLNGGVTIVNKEKVTPGDHTKGARNSEIPEVSSPMSIPERSPYHQSATPSVSGGSSSRSSNSSGGCGGGNGNGLNYDEGNDAIEEIFPPSPIPLRTGNVAGGNRAAGIHETVYPKREKINAQHQKYRTTTRSRNVGGRGSGNSNPANLIQLIESSINAADDFEQYADSVEEEDDEDEEQGYLVDHVDEMDPAIVQMYQDNDNEMMLNTPMVKKEMEKQQQKQRQQRQQRMHQLSGKGGESLLKGAGNRQQQQPGASLQRAQSKSLLSSSSTTSVKAGGSGLRSATTVSSAGSSPLIVTKGGKKLGLAKKQATSTNDQQQGADAPSPGPSGFNGGGGNSATSSIASTSPPIETDGGLSFVAESGGYIPASDVVPSDIFDDSTDQGTTTTTTKHSGSPSPMLSGAFNFEGGFYNPNVNINEMKAGRQQVQLQTQQQNNQQQQQQAPSVRRMTADGGVDGDENSLDSSLLLNQATGNDNDQQLSKFASNDLDVARLNTVAEYGQHIDTVQNDLESLKELLKGEGYQLDANALLGLFNNNEDMLGYDFPMNLPDMLTDDQQQVFQQQQQQQQLLQHQSLTQQPQQQPSGNNNGDKTGTSSSPTPAHRQLMGYKMQGAGGGPTAAAGLVGGNHGILGIGLHGNNMNSNGHGIMNGGGGGGGGVGGLLGGGIVSGDYIDLHELLNMDANCSNGGNVDANSSLVA
uniref:HSF-type DNA-binding domain-containing protein n=1 Tax=Anopheles dirus TaxID=7168 RepID=A0A182NSX7_9DIPT